MLAADVGMAGEKAGDALIGGAKLFLEALEVGEPAADLREEARASSMV